VSAEPITDAEVVSEGKTTPTPSTELATHTAFAVTTPVQASDLVARLDKIREAMNDAMQEDVDYGKIPGTDKPTLLKPGAEKLAVMFRLDVQTTHDEKWGPGDHLTVPAYTVIYDAPTGTRLGRGEGMCSTRERKYAYRNEQRKCPTCGVAAIIKGKTEYGGGWVCFKKKGGCGAKFSDGAAEIEGQTTGEIDNPDLPDLWNTVIKMARKRAIVDAVLLVTGASALFTQDAENLPIVEAPTTTGAEQGPPYGPKVDDSILRQTRKAIAYLLSIESDDERVTGVLRAIAKEAGDYLPSIACGAICRMAKMVRDGTPEAVKDANPDEVPSGDVRDAELLAARSDSIAADEFMKSLDGKDV
jgi:hypothetical protein